MVSISMSRQQLKSPPMMMFVTSRYVLSLLKNKNLSLSETGAYILIILIGSDACSRSTHRIRPELSPIIFSIVMSRFFLLMYMATPAWCSVPVLMWRLSFPNALLRKFKSVVFGLCSSCIRRISSVSLAIRMTFCLLSGSVSPLTFKEPILSVFAVSGWSILRCFCCGLVLSFILSVSLFRFKLGLFLF